MSDDAHATDEQLVLRDVRALLDQLQLDRDGSLTMQSKLTDDLGVDSLALVELCDQLERTFGVNAAGRSLPERRDAARLVGGRQCRSWHGDGHLRTSRRRPDDELQRQ